MNFIYDYDELGSATLLGIYQRTLNNCIFYHDRGDLIHLHNEIGCLRGICYCLEMCGISVVDENDFLHFIDLQNFYNSEDILKNEVSY